jgi:hypothetical protein
MCGSVMPVALAFVKPFCQDILYTIRHAAALRTALGDRRLHLAQTLGEPCKALYEFWWFTFGIFLVMVALK